MENPPKAEMNHWGSHASLRWKWRSHVLQGRVHHTNVGVSTSDGHRISSRSAHGFFPQQTFIHKRINGLNLYLYHMVSNTDSCSSNSPIHSWSSNRRCRICFWEEMNSNNIERIWGPHCFQASFFISVLMMHHKTCAGILFLSLTQNDQEGI